MQTVVGIGGGTRRRRLVRRIVLLALLLLALIEPLIMYRSLMRERDERRALAQGSLVAPGQTAGHGASPETAGPSSD